MKIKHNSHGNSIDAFVNSVRVPARSTFVFPEGTDLEGPRQIIIDKLSELMPGLGLEGIAAEQLVEVDASKLIINMPMKNTQAILLGKTLKSVLKALGFNITAEHTGIF